MDNRLDWYLKARFGLFIHWGAYAAAGVEASWPIMAPKMSEAMFRVPSAITEAEYVQLPARFDPSDFKPREWVECARNAGMGYMVITAKHHDGFCMFDAPGTDYKITNTPYGKDICRELADACGELDMPLGFYYSPPDMHHPGYRDTSRPVTENWTGEPKRKEWGAYLDYMESHIRTLLTGYGDVCLLWFDGLANHGKYNPDRFHKLIHELNPRTLINDRLGEGFDFVTPEQFLPKEGIPARSELLPSGMDPAGDGFFRSVNFLFKLPGFRGLIKSRMEKYNDGEFELSKIHQEPYPPPERFQPWETCMTIGTTWAYNPEEKSWKEPGELIRNLVSVAAKGGNYLLNVGPGGSGEFPGPVVDRLRSVGGWLARYGEAVFGTTYTPLPFGEWGRATRSGNKVYLFIFTWPEDGKLAVTPFPGTVNSVNLFSGEPLPFVREGDSLLIELPGHPADPDVSVLTVDIGGDESPWIKYSDPVEEAEAPKKYIRKKAVGCGWINSLLNGLIALFAYLGYDSFTFKEVAVDVVITMAIISFLVAWLLIGSTRKDLFKRIVKKREKPFKRTPVVKVPVVRALLIMVFTTIILGALVGGLVFLLAPRGMSSWSYTILKTIFTGVTGAFAAIFAVRSVIREQGPVSGK